MTATALRILIPLPDRDFDTTEASVPWDAAKRAGHQVIFATEHGTVPSCDPHLLTRGWRNPMPAKQPILEIYQRMTADPNFLHPITYNQINAKNYDAVHLPGGHSQGIKQYLENKQLQQKVATLHHSGKIVGAICHGTLILARAQDQETGKSLLYGRTVTTLTKPIERFALITTFCRAGHRHRTYPKYTEDEIREALGPQGHIEHGNSWRTPLTAIDERLITARYPPDIHQYSKHLLQLTKATAQPKQNDHPKTNLPPQY